jgi:4-phospho-D-threonate 3-dehydrogenase / 4-phospho-D-erythronate 3-dehydrogenase
MNKPLLALTLGDPAGVGPEIVAKAWAHPTIHECCRPLVVGHPDVLRSALRLIGSHTQFRAISEPEEVDSTPERVCCLAVGRDDVLNVVPGSIDGRAGQAAYDALVAAAQLAIAGRIDGLITAPLHKAALWKAGHRYPGHTELLAELCGVSDYAMMLYLGSGEQVRSPAGLAIVHVTLHMALRDVFASLTREAVLAKTHLVADFMAGLSGTKPRIGVCALNPHAGEEGLFGDEETSIIAPAVNQARLEGLDVQGPYPADTLIARARSGQFDAVVAMYHDQGHIAIKLMAMHKAVNVTLGLPIVRTSVAHGTAFDLAWQGQAESAGLVEAVRVASKLALKRKANQD